MEADKPNGSRTPPSELKIGVCQPALSRPARIALLVLTVLYFAGALCMALVFLMAVQRSVAGWDKRVIVKTAVQYTIVSMLCGISYVLALKGRKSAEIWSAAASFITAFIAAKPTIYALVNGFGLTNIVEPVLVLPAVSVVLISIIRKGGRKTQ